MTVRRDLFPQRPRGTRRLWTVLGILLPFVTIGVGLLLPRSAPTGVLIPATFAVLFDALQAHRHTPSSWRRRSRRAFRFARSPLVTGAMVRSGP